MTHSKATSITLPMMTLIMYFLSMGSNDRTYSSGTDGVMIINIYDTPGEPNPRPISEGGGIHSSMEP